MEILLSHFASGQTGVEIHTEKGKTYTTDDFRKSILNTLVSQEPGDSIIKLVIHRGTSKGQVLAGDLESDVKEKILILLAK